MNGLMHDFEPIEGDIKIQSTRGFRNNNPGNIERGQKFEGEVLYLYGIPEEHRFAQFEHMEYGIRAIYRILKTYEEKYGIETISSIVNRWAPPVENDVDAYIKAVLDVFKMDECIKSMGKKITENTKLGKSSLLYALMCGGIIKVENGENPFAISMLEDTCLRSIPEWYENIVA